jgi:hypothetical protein
MPKRSLASERIKEYLQEFPAATNNEIMLALNMTEPTFYRAKRQLKKEEITNYISVEFPIPPNILKRILPPTRYKYTHLAAFLTKFRLDETVPPYGKTKREIMYDIRVRFNNDAEETEDLVYGLQERLAICALIKGDISSFNRSNGTINPPNEY